MCVWSATPRGLYFLKKRGTECPLTKKLVGPYSRYGHFKKIKLFTTPPPASSNQNVTPISKFLLWTFDCVVHYKIVK